MASNISEKWTYRNIFELVFGDIGQNKAWKIKTLAFQFLYRGCSKNKERKGAWLDLIYFYTFYLWNLAFHQKYIFSPILSGSLKIFKNDRFKILERNQAPSNWKRDQEPREKTENPRLFIVYLCDIE